MESVATRHSELEYLTKRVEELERENGLFLSWMSACSHCSSKITQKTLSSNEIDANKEEISTGVQDDDSFEVPFFSMEGVEQSKGINNKPIDCVKYAPKEEISGCKERTMAHANKRYIALKIMYFGQRFYGFASEAQMDPTVEVIHVGSLLKMDAIGSKQVRQVCGDGLQLWLLLG